MMAVTSLPSARPSSAAASTVIDATSRTPPASIVTLAVASPLVIPVTLAGILFRALSRMVIAPFSAAGIAAIVPRQGARAVALGICPAGAPVASS